MISDLKKQVEEQIQKAESLAEKLNTSIDTYENHNKQTITACLKTKLINDIETLSNKILEKAIEEEQSIKQYFIFSEPNEVVWIRAIRSKNYLKPNINIEPYTVLKDAAAEISSKLMYNPNYRCLSKPEFNHKIDSLKIDISSGRMNNILHYTAEEALWKAMEKAS
jgi:multidrug efflux pump subunit AcrB